MYRLRFLFASHPVVMGQVLSIVYRGIAAANACRTPGLDELGATPQAHIQYRHRDLPCLRWRSESGCLY